MDWLSQFACNTGPWQTSAATTMLACLPTTSHACSRTKRHGDEASGPQSLTLHLVCTPQKDPARHPQLRLAVHTCPDAIKNGAAATLAGCLTGPRPIACRCTAQQPSMQAHSKIAMP